MFEIWTRKKILATLLAITGSVAVALWVWRYDEFSEYHGDPKCAAVYEKWFGEREYVDIRIIFGYKDARPARFVGDRYERAVFIEKIIKPCEGENEACGFIRDQRNGRLFKKRIFLHDGRSVDIRMRVVESSAGPDDEENRKDSHQLWMSTKARDEFIEGIQKADIVFYNGHSRDGGGPDFQPARLRADSHVDYDWYQQTRVGTLSLLAALKSAHSLRALGLFSCASTGHFAEDIRTIRSSLVLFTEPRLVYQSEAMDSSLQSLSKLLAQKCLPELKKLK